MSDQPENTASQPETSEEGPEQLAEHRARMRHDWSNLIEDLIEEGRQQGIFDNLPGVGKPLKLNRNPYGREKELAHDLLQKNDLLPAWIMQRNDLLVQIQTLRGNIQRNWVRHEQEYRYAASEPIQDSLSISWDDKCLAWESQIQTLNRRINDFNLKRPSSSLELFKLSLEEELERAGARRWLK
jgi:DnaJ family protein C protein 28